MPDGLGQRVPGSVPVTESDGPRPDGDGTPREREEEGLIRPLAPALLAGALFLGPGTALAQHSDIRVLVDDLDFPTAIAFSPDGKLMYVNEREGRIRVIDRDGLRDEPLATIPTTTEGETGLLGIAVSPEGDELFVFATDPEGSSNRVLRIPASGGDPEEIVSGLPASLYHNGGGLAFDKDGWLLVANGETHDTSNAQDPDVLGGKIYRFTTSGAAAPGNPFGDAIALGLRNPFGLTVDPVTGDAFVTDNGPSSHDEVNRIRVGGNYGWPDVLGFAGDARPSGPGGYHDPVTVQEDIVVPTGIAIADPATAVPEVAGDLFYGTYSEQTIRRVRLNEGRDDATSDEVFVREEEPVVAVAWGPRGLYYATPSAIKLVALARPNREGKRRSPEVPDLTEGPLIPNPEPEEPWPLVTFGIVVIVVGVIALVLARR